MSKVDRGFTVPKIDNLTEVVDGDSTLFLRSKFGEDIGWKTANNLFSAFS